jgi:hypothetical protein
MDFQKMFDAISEASARERSNYHLTYGDLIDALKAAPADATFDEQIVGLGSYRGYYTDIALYTGDEGYTASDTNEDFNGDWQTEYDAWSKKHTVGATSLPKEAHKLAEVLEGLIGNYFTGYKGGEYEITRDKALWVASDAGDCTDKAVLGISDDLKLTTKVIND